MTTLLVRAAFLVIGFLLPIAIQTMIALLARAAFLVVGFLLPIAILVWMLTHCVKCL